MTESQNTFGKGRGAAMERGDQKRLAVYKWLYQFNVSTQRLLASMLCVEERGQHQFFSRLLKSGYVESFNHPGLGRERLYRLTPAGYILAAQQHGFKEGRRAQVSDQVLLHDLTVQKAVANRMEIETEAGRALLIDYIAERHNGAPLNGKKPDAMLDYGVRVVALELELSHKNNSRVYYNFLSHLYNIRDKHYSHVAYLFTSPKLRDLYEEKFSQPEWPVFRVGRNNRLEKTETSYKRQANISNFFSFEIERGYFI